LVRRLTPVKYRLEAVSAGYVSRKMRLKNRTRLIFSAVVYTPEKARQRSGADYCSIRPLLERAAQMQ
jgi:hypothetical protein